MQSRRSGGSLFISLFVFAACCSSIWLINHSIHPELPQAGKPPRLYSNQCRQDLRLTLLSALKAANQSIYLAVFGLSDVAVVKTLENKIDAGVETSVYYDPGGGALRLSSSEYRKAFNPIRRSGLMHQKILVIDRDLVLIGSANMTSASLRMHDNLIVGFRSPSVAQFLIQHTPFSSGHLKTSVGGQPIEIWLLPDPGGDALANMRNQIKAASKSIRIALFTLTHPSLLDELLEAKRRGVVVTLAIDAHSGLGASSKAINRLKKGGIAISFSQGLQLLHHKFMLIDEKTLISGSANWTKAAFMKNSDCLLILHQLTQDQKNYMNTLWRRIVIESKNI